ncbi:MAG: ABC transporter ATP-binding protein [Coriobacteriales bacterium]|jgi:iron complex transport system ATP-binding protein|nr:ABC transporter ATP-binding protein [Coriobacteriales bacterium]
MSMLEVRNLTVRFGNMVLVDDVSFTVEPGERLMIVGPNGAGKSTLVSAVAQGVPYEGTVLLDGKDVRSFKPAELARRLGMLMQTHFVGYSFSVEEVVRLGRYAHARNFLAARSEGDNEKVAEALASTGLTDMADQSVLTLSGGELQRTFLAQVFAQDPNLLILDEPTNHLDLVYQKRVFGLINEWLGSPRRAVLAVVHDLSLARAFATRVMLMCHGRLVCIGTPEETLVSEKLDAIYEMDVRGWMHDLLVCWQ